jgi:urease accessory protein
VCGSLALLAAPADAHLIDTGLGPFYDGILHFVLTPEDLAPTLALALFVGLRGADHGRRALFILPIVWLLGGCIGIANDFTLGAHWNWLPLLLLGGLAAADMRLSLGATTLLIGVFGLYAGYQNGIAMTPPAGPGLTGLIGVASSVVVVVTLIAAWIVSLQAAWTRIAARVAGSWIAATGLLLLGWSLR